MLCSHPAFTRNAAFLLLTSLTLGAPQSPADGKGDDILPSLDRNKYGVCLLDGANLGRWKVEFGGEGCFSVKEEGNKPVMHLRPKESIGAEETHAALATGPSYSGDLDLMCTAKTICQLRKKNPGKNWEVGWVVWNFTDLHHFYYFALKPKGWELGKRDRRYRGCQRFLATGYAPSNRLGKSNRYVIRQRGNTISVAVDGKQVARFTDNERPYLKGKIGAYCEDAEVTFSEVMVTCPKPPG